MSVTWGTAVGTSGEMKLGYEFRQSPATILSSTASVTLYLDIWIWTKWSVSDSSNTFALAGTDTLDSTADVTISTTVDSSWSTSNKKLLRTVSRTFAPSYTSTTTSSFTCSLSGVDACGSGSTAALSGSWTTAKRPYATPLAPSEVSVARVSDTQHTLHWINNSSTERPYSEQRVIRKLYGGTLADIATVSAAATNYTDNGTVADREYQWLVEAYGSDGTKATSALTAAICTTPLVSGSVTARRYGQNNVVTWVPTSTIVDVHELWQSQNGGAASVVASTKAGINTWTHSLAATNVTRKYGIKSVCYTGTERTSALSSYSPIITGKYSTISNTSYSGGEYVVVGVSATFAIPKSSFITLKYLCSNCASAVFKLDSGSWTALSATGTSRSWSSLTATHHTLAFRVHLNAAAGPLDGLFIDYFDYSPEGTWALASGVSISATAEHIGFATLDDALYFSTEYNAIKKFDGTTFSAVTASGTATGPFLVEKGRRLFCAGSAADPSLLKYTSLDKPHDWNGGGSIYLAGQDSGGKCTGLAVWNNYVFWFSESRTYVLSTTGTPDNWEAKTLSYAHGCIAPNSIAALANGIIFLSHDGVRGYGYIDGLVSDDGSAFYPMSLNIDPTLAAYTNDERKHAVGAVWKNRYWLAIGGDVYVCDLEKRTENKQPPWTKFTGHDINCLYVTRADEALFYAGSAEDGIIYSLDTGGNDNGEPIPLLYRTPPLAARGYTSVKHIKHTHVAAESPSAQAVQVSLKTDDVSSAEQTVTFDADDDLQPKRILTPARGRYAQVEIASDGLDQDLTVSEITVTYNPKPRVR